MYTTLLSIQNVSIGYQKPLITNINAQLKSGEIGVLMGNNGSGKSTLINTIIKQINSLEGDIFLQNTNIKKLSIEALSKFISVVFSQHKISNSISVYELVSLGRFPYKKWYEKPNIVDIEIIENALEITKLQAIKHKTARTLSDGNLQKVFIARAIAQQTPIMILDEPLSHLDLENQFTILSIFKKLVDDQNKTILFTSHDWDSSLSIADALWLIKNNQFVSGNVEDIALQNNLLHVSTDSNFHFNYGLNKFMQNIDNKKNNSIKILPNRLYEEAYYWLQKALIKNGFSIDNTAEIHIDILHNSHYKLYTQKKVFDCETIQQIIKILT